MERFNLDSYASIVRRGLDINKRISGLITNGAIGYIECIHPKAPYSFVAGATFLTPRIMITARHALNGFMCSDLQVRVNSLTSRICLVQDGAIYRQDYVLLFAVDISTTPIPRTFEFPNGGSTFYCIVVKNYGLQIFPAKVQNSAYEILTFDSTLKTSSGFSGCPYIDDQGRFFGFHVSSYLPGSIWEGEATGLLLKWLDLDSNKNLSRAIHSPPLLPRNYFFDDDFRYSIPSIGQIDQACRESALGNTPALDSLTGTQVLLRYFLRNKAHFSGTAEENIILANWRTCWRKYVKYYLSFRALEEAKDAYRTLYNILSQIQNWAVYITVPGENEDLDHPQRALIALNTLRSNQNKAIQMGHKMGAVDYWAYGAGDRNNPEKGWLKRERIGKISRNKYNSSTQLDGKIRSLEERYVTYRNPGHEEYPAPKMKSFMKEPWNYHFQWWAINQRDGRLTGQIIKYKNL